MRSLTIFLYCSALVFLNIASESNATSQKEPKAPTIDVLDFRDYPFANGPIKAIGIEGSPFAPRDRPFDIVEVYLSGYRIQFSYLSQGDIIAMGDGLYRVLSPRGKKCIKWISDDEWPPGISPQLGSIFIPLQCKLDGNVVITPKRFFDASLSFLGHQKSADKKTILATMIAGRGNVNRTPTTLEFTVKTGDIVLVELYGYDYFERKSYVERIGYKVRAIVPADEKTRVRGWVELDANGIPEADLIHDKIAFIRPLPRKEGAK